jgi:hypothetical protein
LRTLLCSFLLIDLPLPTLSTSTSSVTRGKTRKL